jgi:hypothetical protein
MLQKYDIISLPDIELQNINILNELYGITLFFEYNDVNNNPWSSFNSLNAVKNKKRKEIGKMEAIWSVRDIIGYYKNPFENRIVVYVIEKYSEGPQEGNTFCYFFGCHLNIGFKY